MLHKTHSKKARLSAGLYRCYNRYQKNGFRGLDGGRSQISNVLVETPPLYIGVVISLCRTESQRQSLQGILLAGAEIGWVLYPCENRMKFDSHGDGTLRLFALIL